MRLKPSTRHIRVILVLMMLFFPGPRGCPAALAGERILDFRSRVECQGDASIIVEERITVQSEGQSIRHGIYRDLPLQNWAGRPSRLGIQSALLDGSPVQVKEIPGGRASRIYLGDSRALLPPGVHVFTLLYQMDSQVGNLSDRDEIYWNVTGTGWTFPIERVSCLVIPPSGMEAGGGLKVSAYTGTPGSRGEDANISIGRSGVLFETTRTFFPGEGLTVAVGWPKGFVAFGSWRDRNPGWIVFFLGMGLVFLYYLLAWFLAGRDAPRGVIVPRFDSPPGMTPSQVRRLARMGLDIKGLSAEIVDLAVKGVLVIRESDGSFSLSMSSQPELSSLPSHQKDLCNSLLSLGLNTSRRAESLKSMVRQGGLLGGLARFGMKVARIPQTPSAAGDRIEIPLSGSVSREFHHAWISFKRRVESSEPSRKLFSRNTGIWALGLLGSMIALAGMLYANHPRGFLAGGGAFLALWLSFWTLGVALLLAAAAAAWSAAISTPSCSATVGALFMTLFSLPFLGAEIFVLVTLSRISFTPLATQLLPAVFMVFATAAFFRFLLKRYTREGQAAMDAIEGYRQYLSMAERGLLHSLSGPTPSPALFERHLPFAMALDVEEAWTSRFSSILGPTYAPAWVEGDLKPGSTGFSSHFAGAFAGAVSAAGASSGGSGGGGSSGGGGGGGGGGGW